MQESFVDLTPPQPINCHDNTRAMRRDKMRAIRDIEQMLDLPVHSLDRFLHKRKAPTRDILLMLRDAIENKLKP